MRVLFLVFVVLLSGGALCQTNVTDDGSPELFLISGDGEAGPGPEYQPTGESAADRWRQLASRVTNESSEEAPGSRFKEVVEQQMEKTKEEDEVKDRLKQLLHMVLANKDAFKVLGEQLHQKLNDLKENLTGSGFDLHEALREHLSQVGSGATDEGWLEWLKQLVAHKEETQEHMKQFYEDHKSGESHENATHLLKEMGKKKMEDHVKQLLEAMNERARGLEPDSNSQGYVTVSITKYGRYTFPIKDMSRVADVLKTLMRLLH